MNILILLSGLLTLVGAVAHGIGGELMIFRKMQPEVFPTMPNGDGAQAKAETRMTWHGITVYFAITGVILLLVAFDQLDQTYAQLSALYVFAFAILLALLPPLTLRDARAAIRSPQWVLMLLIAGFALGGTL